MNMKKILPLAVVSLSSLLFACQTNEMDSIVASDKKVQYPPRNYCVLNVKISRN